jgi:hypothetical protein
MFYKVVFVSFVFVLFVLMFIILVLICLLSVSFIWHLLVVYKAIFALEVPVIICFNYNKARHKFYTYPKPQKPSIIHKIKRKDFNTNVINVINKDLGKKQA